jgi:hypothetical protein
MGRARNGAVRRMFVRQGPAGGNRRGLWAGVSSRSHADQQDAIRRERDRCDNALAVAVVLQHTVLRASRVPSSSSPMALRRRKREMQGPSLEEVSLVRRLSYLVCLRDVSMMAATHAS